jgi:DNA repair exonuclease SbcCD nuclease subunit
MLDAIIADLHMRGKKLSDKVQALTAAVDECLRRKVNRVTFVGDTFDHRNISDREATTGMIFKSFMDQVQRLLDAGIAVVVIKGNGIHEGKIGNQPGPLEVLKRQGITVVDHGILMAGASGYVISYIPAVDNEEEFKSLHSNLEMMKEQFIVAKKAYKIILHHLSISGAQLNNGMAMTGAEFEVSPEQLEDLGADLILGGHIHKRQKYYVGALCQGDFGEEGNPQGFAVVDTEKRTVEYVEIDAPRYFTVEAFPGMEHKLLPEYKPTDYAKVRVKAMAGASIDFEGSEEVFANPRITVEIIPEREVVKREVAGVEAGRSDIELLDAFLVDKGRSEAERTRIAAVAQELAGGIR